MRELTVTPNLTEEIVRQLEKKFSKSNYLQMNGKTLCLLRSEEQESQLRKYLEGKKYAVETASRSERNTAKNEQEDRKVIARRVEF